MNIAGREVVYLLLRYSADRCDGLTIGKNNVLNKCNLLDQSTKINAKELQYGLCLNMSCHKQLVLYP